MFDEIVAGNLRHFDITKNIDISMKCAFVHRTQSEWENWLPLSFGLISQR